MVESAGTPMDGSAFLSAESELRARVANRAEPGSVNQRASRSTEAPSPKLADEADLVELREVEWQLRDILQFTGDRMEIPDIVEKRVGVGRSTEAGAEATAEPKPCAWRIIDIANYPHRIQDDGEDIAIKDRDALNACTKSGQEFRIERLYSETDIATLQHQHAVTGTPAESGGAELIRSVADWIETGTFGSLNARPRVIAALRSLAGTLATLQHQHAERLHGVTWLLIRNGCVLLEKCPKKAAVLGVGEWFVPGGKIEGDETPEQALRREIAEEWPGAELRGIEPLPIIEGSAIPPGPRGLFLMRPFVVTVSGDLPSVSGDGVALRWTPISEALASPVPQVRMMLAAALTSAHQHAEQEERIAALQGKLDAIESRRFPIADGPDIPWSAIAPFEKQAWENHRQTLERLAERGGLSVIEALLVLECEPLYRARFNTLCALPKRDAIFALQQLATRPSTGTPTP